MCFQANMPGKLAYQWSYTMQASYRSNWFPIIDGQPPVWVVYTLKCDNTRTMDMHPELSYVREIYRGNIHFITCRFHKYTHTHTQFIYPGYPPCLSALLLLHLTQSGSDPQHTVTARSPHCLEQTETGEN